MRLIQRNGAALDEIVGIGGMVGGSGTGWPLDDFIALKPLENNREIISGIGMQTGLLAEFADLIRKIKSWITKYGRGS